MATLKINNNYSNFVSEDQEIKTLLWQALRFKERNYFHTSLYKQKKWDGYRDFFTKGTGKFLTGLLPIVQLALSKLNQEYDIIDNREHFDFTHSQVDENILNHDQNSIVLYDYQTDLINQAIKYKRGIIQAPTGCHRKGQLILTSAKKFKKVEDIEVGDKLMGQDSQERVVLSLCRGNGKMYEIKSKVKKHPSFIVNEDHILTLINIKTNEIEDIVLKEFLNKNINHYRIFTNEKKYNYECREFKVIDLNVNEDYYGFTLDGDGRYLLNDFTVTHNSGKTNVLIGILKCLPPKLPTLILSKSISLTEQNYSEITHWGLPAGRFYGSKKDPNYITCATVQSIEKLESILDKIKCLIVDEVHEGGSAQFVELYKKLTNTTARFGISATPFKFGKKDKVQMYQTMGWFGPVFKIKSIPGGSLNTKFLQDRKNLSPSTCTFYPVTEPNIPYDIYMDAVTHGIAESDYFNKLIHKLCLSLEGRTLILVERVEHGKKLNELIENSVWIYGKDNMDVRKPILSKLKTEKGNFIVIATRHILNTGINLMIHNLINCAGGKADHDIVQRIGRGLRNSDDKEKLLYYDFNFKINPYLEEHSKHRIKIFQQEGHEVIVKDNIDF